MREAARLLDGVRQGQPLGALLGYRFERGCTISSSTGSSRRLRALAPLVVRARIARASPPRRRLESIAANNVVDGLVLLRRWQEETAVVNVTISGPLAESAGSRDRVA